MTQRFYRRAFDALSVEQWAKWDDDVTLTCMHPDYPDSLDTTSAEEFFHYGFKKFDLLRKVDAQFAKVKYPQDESDEDEVHHHETSDEDEQEETIPIAKPTVKDKIRPF